MLVFEKFELAPGVRLDARIARGRVHVLTLDPEHVHEDFIARYLAGGGARSAAGELWLEEVRDAEGKPTALRRLKDEKLRGFFARFVGFVLRDGGLLDGLTVRENLLLSRRYHDVWPRGTVAGAEGMEELLRELAGDDVAGVAAAEVLERRPEELTVFARRYWGLMTTLLRRPQLLIAFAPFDGLRVADQEAIAGVLARYRRVEPTSAHLLVVTGAHETAALAGVDVVELRPRMTAEEFST